MFGRRDHQRKEEAAKLPPDAYAINRAWEVDRESLTRDFIVHYRRIAYASLAVGLVCAAAVLLQGPLRRFIPIVTVVDKTTGETTVRTALTEETIPALDALDKHNVAVFVRARESYHWNFLQRDYDTVARMADAKVFGEYANQFTGKEPLHKRLGATEEWRINIVGVRLAATSRQGNSGEAVVTYDKELRSAERQVVLATTRHVATVRFNYAPKALTKEKDRIENPFGFIAMAYRSDPEITASPTATAPAPVAAP